MQIFISYRRSDSQAIARLIGEKLRDEYGSDSVFQDMTEIEPGADFAEIIRKALERSDVFLALIGRDWAREGAFSDSDYVRLEVETALSNRLEVLPVLVEGCEMPQADALPESVQLLTRINATHVDSRGDLDSHMKRLCDAIEVGTDTRAKLGEQYRIIRNARRAALALEQADWKFSVDVTGDQYVFLLTLKRFLDSTKNLFKVQSALADDLVRGIKVKCGGKDDVIREVADQIPADRYWLRRRLRRETDTMREVHGALLRLLSRNRDLYSLVPNLQELYDHLSMWVAKYECLRDDDTMCLIFVGVKQKMKFPTKVEEDIGTAVNELDERLKFR
jgi:hypothetical protein